MTVSMQQLVVSPSKNLTSQKSLQKPSQKLPQVLVLDPFTSLQPPVQVESATSEMENVIKNLLQQSASSPISDCAYCNDIVESATPPLKLTKDQTPTEDGSSATDSKSSPPKVLIAEASPTYEEVLTPKKSPNPPVTKKLPIGHGNFLTLQESQFPKIPNTKLEMDARTLATKVKMVPVRHDTQDSDSSATTLKGSDTSEGSASDTTVSSRGDEHLARNLKGSAQLRDTSRATLAPIRPGGVRRSSSKVKVTFARNMAANPGAVHPKFR